MKKLIKITLTILILSLTFTTGVFASQYMQWRGTENYENTIITLENIRSRSSAMQDEIRDLEQELNNTDNTIRDLENVVRDKDNVILDKNNQIDSLEQDIVALNKRIDELENRGSTDRDQLEQAYKDVQHLESLADEILNGME